MNKGINSKSWEAGFELMSYERERAKEIIIRGGLDSRKTCFDFSFLLIKQTDLSSSLLSHFLDFLF